MNNNKELCTTEGVPLNRGQSHDWLTVTGKSASKLAESLHQRVAARITNGEYTWNNVGYIERVNRNPLGPDANLSKQQLEMLRKACQLWDLELRPAEITSHRKFLGPLIVAAKKLLYPILKVLLRDVINQQRDFNAAAIALLAHLSDSSKPNDRSLKAKEQTIQ